MGEERTRKREERIEKREERIENRERYVTDHALLSSEDFFSAQPQST